jgi:hypothetical protein
MTITHGVRSALLLAAVTLLAGVRSHAATVEFSVVERAAGPVPDQTVLLYPVSPDIQADPLYFLNTRPAGRCTTDDTGRCRIADLRVGVYVPYLLAIADPNLAAPLGPPMVAYGTVTVLKPDANVLLRIELQRGVRVQFRVLSEKAAIPPRSRVELVADSGEQATAELDTRGAAKITLGSGRWIAHLSGPPGARVVNAELDGSELTTPDVPIELIAPSSDRFVTWTISAPCVVRGTVTSTRKPPAVTMGATLVTPGPWGASRLCRATHCAGTPSAPVLPNGSYAIEVPSGAWRIAPAGLTLLESNPPSVDVTCGEGQYVSADFDVRETEPGAGPKTVLVVRVDDPDGRPVPGVAVEVWPQSGNLEAAAPIAEESTGLFLQPAAFAKLAAGSYLLRVRRSGYRTAVLALPDLDPEARAPRSVTVRLDRGATIDALVTDDKDRPVTGVALIVKRMDEPPGSDDPAARLAEPDAEVSVPPSMDQTAHVVVTGLAAGTYDVTPVLTGAIASAAVTSVAVGDGPGTKHVVVGLGDHDILELIVRVRPAASLTGRLVCADAGLLPYQADTCLLGHPDEDEDEATRKTCRSPLIATGSITLSGDRRDVFRVGPLTPGSYRLGLRPRGYTAFTWALGTPEGAQAAVVQINGTDAADLGTIPVFCGPAVELLPTVLSHDPPPDLSLATVEAELTRTSPNGKIERRVVPAERDRDRVVLRELPEGEWTLDATISHRFFVPPAPVHLSVPVKLERGVLSRAGVAIASVGGAVVIDGATGTARVLAPDGTARVETAKDGTIAINGVAAGFYDVEMCEDSRCARVLRRWEAVQVIRGQKVVLAAPSP